MSDPGTSWWARMLARRAPLLLAEPLEDLLARDLAEVQRGLGLPVTA